MQIDERKPEDVLKPQFVNSYKSLHKDIWDRLVQVKTSITILDRIIVFPFHYITSLKDNVFWGMVYWNFLYMSILFLHTLTEDQGSNKLTLRRFKNLLVKDWMKEQEKASLSTRLKTCNFSKAVEAVHEKNAQMRNIVIAHRVFNSTSYGSLQQVPGVSVPELFSSCKAVEKLFQACSFGSEYVTTLYLPMFFQGKPVQKDVDNILDGLIKDSPWLHQPERKAGLWPLLKKEMPKDEIKELNFWRKKFGLSEV